MKIPSCLVLVLLVLFATCAAGSGSSLEGPDGPVSFSSSKATSAEENDGHVWHIVQNNEIPEGVHVNINMATGVKKWRKLTAEEENDATRRARERKEEARAQLSAGGGSSGHALAAIPEEEKIHVDDSIMEARNAILKESEVLGEMNRLSLDHIVEKEGPARHRPSDEKAAEMAAEYLRRRWEKMSIMSESQLMREKLVELLALPHRNETIERRVEILGELEGLVHQIDAAVDFCKLKGHLDLIAMMDPNHGEVIDPVRDAVLKVILAAIRNNPGAQEYLVREGMVRHMLDLMRRPNVNAVLNGRAVSTLTALLMNNASAKVQFMKLRGHEVLKDFLFSPHLVGDWLAAKLKAAVFIAHFVRDEPQSPPAFLEKLREGALCEKLMKFLLYEEVHREMDAVDKLSDAVAAIVEGGHCAENIHTVNSYHGVFAHIASHWEQKVEDRAEFVDELRQRFDRIQSLVDASIKKNQKNDL